MSAIGPACVATMLDSAALAGVGHGHPQSVMPHLLLQLLDALPHPLRMLVEPALDGFKNVLIFPSDDPSSFSDMDPCPLM